MKLVPAVSPEAGVMSEIAVARSLSLCPIAHVVKSDHSNRPRHPDQHAKIDAQVFEPEGTLEAVVDQPPVHTDRVPGT